MHGRPLQENHGAREFFVGFPKFILCFVPGSFDRACCAIIDPFYPHRVAPCILDGPRLLVNSDSGAAEVQTPRTALTTFFLRASETFSALT